MSARHAMLLLGSAKAIYSCRSRRIAQLASRCVNQSGRGCRSWQCTRRQRDAQIEGGRRAPAPASCSVATGHRQLRRLHPPSRVLCSLLGEFVTVVALCSSAVVLVGGWRCCQHSWALFRYPQNSKFFHSLSITSIFSRLHEALNVGKKITNCTV